MNTTSEEIDRSSPTAIYHFGRSYQSAANYLVDWVESGARPRLSHDSPIYYLYSHAIELAFKSFLRAKRMTIDELKRQFRHDLSNLHKACIDQGLLLNQETTTAIQMLSNSAREHEFRYIQTGYKRRLELSALREIVEALFVAIRPHVPYSAPAQPDT